MSAAELAELREALDDYRDATDNGSGDDEHAAANALADAVELVLTLLT